MGLLLDLNHEVDDLLSEARARLSDHQSLQRFFGTLAGARVHPLDHYVLLEHGVLQTQADRLIHALVGSMDLRLGLARQVDQCQVGPGFGMRRVHVVHMGEHLLGFVHVVEVVIGDSQVEESEGLVEVLRAHQEHYAGVLPHLLFDVDLASPLEDELIFDLVSGQIADSDALLVEVESCCEISQFVVAVSSLSIAIE